MELIHQYLDTIVNEIQKLKETQSKAIDQASTVVAQSMLNGGYLYCFGTGHSHLVAEELYARAGGLALVRAILEPEITLQDYPTKSTFIERLSGYSEQLLNLYPVTSKDTMLIISNSGRNSAIVEMALAAKQKGMKVIAITSITHSSSVSSRHPSQKRLMDIADVTIDTLTPAGDAGFYIASIKEPVGGLSNLMGIAIGESIIVSTIEKLSQHDFELPIFVSSNLDGADQRNNELFKKYL